MSNNREERIKAEAYRRWEQEGRPHGEHDRHWQEATKALDTGEASDIIESEGTTQAVRAPKAKVAKPKVVKAVAARSVAPKAVAEEAKPDVAAPKRTRAKKAAAE
jgi:hypothetical protein